MKLKGYVFIMVGLILLLQLSGIVNPLQNIFDALGIEFDDEGAISSFDFNWKDFFNNLFGDAGILAILGGTVGAVIIGLTTRVQVENLILLPFLTGTLVKFIEVFVSIIKYSLSFSGAGATVVIAVTSMIFIPLTVGFMITAAEFFRGTDS